MEPNLIIYLENIVKTQNIMKQFIYLFIALAFNSCVDQASDEIEFTLFNETDKTVKVLGFNTQLDVNSTGKAETITINPNSEFKVVRINGLDNNTLMGFYSLRSGVDSVRVIFENLKIKIYSENISPITEFSIFRGNDNRQHFITEQDYEEADDCNGNCE